MTAQAKTKFKSRKSGVGKNNAISLDTDSEDEQDVGVDLVVTTYECFRAEQRGSKRLLFGDMLFLTKVTLSRTMTASGFEMFTRASGRVSSDIDWYTSSEQPIRALVALALAISRGKFLALI